MEPKRRQWAGQIGILIGVWSGIAVVSALHDYLLSLIQDEWRPSLVSLLQWQVPQWGPWIVLTPVVLWLGRRVPIAKGRWLPSIGFHLAAGTLVVLLHTAAMTGLTLWMRVANADEAFGEFYVQLLGIRFLTSLFVYGAILGVGYAVAYYRKYREHELAASQLETQLAQAHLQALKMQLHPHFLFNTLHAVAVLIQEDPAAAARMVTQLGDFLRLATDTVGTQEVSLEEELEFLELYLAIEQTRFHDRLAVRFDVDAGTLTARVPSFILQPLVENAIKHGVGGHAGEGRIAIGSARRDGRLIMSVEDGGNGRATPPVETWKDGVGLRTTRERLTRMYGDAHRVSIEPVDQGVRVSVSIPYRAERDDG